MPEDAFSSDPRRPQFKSGFFKNKQWEELINTQEKAEKWFRRVTSALSECGVSVTKKTKILEVGTGKGILLERLRQEDYDIVGVNARPRHTERPARIAAARIECLPFRDNTFEIVWSSGIFDSGAYEQNQSQMLAEIARVLKPGGVFVSGNDRPSAMARDMVPLTDYADRGRPMIYRKDQN